MSIEVVDLNKISIDEWFGIVIENKPFKPLWWIPGISMESQCSLEAHEVKNAYKDKNCRLLGASKDGHLIGIAQLRYMEWDSNHFGSQVFRMENFGTWCHESDLHSTSQALIGAIIDLALNNGADLIHTWIPMDAIRSIQACEKAGFQIVDVLTTWVFEHTRRRIPEYGNQHIIREYQPVDADVLLPLAREVFNRTPDRFHCDPYLPKHLSSDLYAEWFRNSCTGQLADHIVVAEFDGKPAGFITLKIGDDHNLLSNVKTGGIMLIATAPWASGKGICTSMLISSLKWLESQGVEVSHVGTQVNNYYVQRACAGIGFRPVKSGPSMHLWLHK